MTPSPQLQSAVQRLFACWLHQCRQQVGKHVADNGDQADAETTAAACESTFGDCAVAAWALEQNGKGLIHEQ